MIKGFYMKNLENNFGVTYSSTAKDEFFQDLERPIDKARVNNAKKLFRKTKNVKVEFVGL